VVRLKNFPKPQKPFWEYFVFFVFAMCACTTTHQVSKNWKADAEFHWHECSDCDELFDKGAHDMQLFDSKEVSCAEEGYVTYKCSVCGYTKKDTTPATGHAMEKHNAISGDCETAGASEYYSCSKCGKFYSDPEGEHEIAENSWVIPCAGHTLTHVEGKEATKTQAGLKDHYYCEVCHKTYADAAATQEITDGVEIKQLVSSVAEARTMPVGSELIVRGVVAGVTTTQASLNLINAITFKDEFSNVSMALSGGKNGASALANAMGTAANIIMPFEKGTILEIPVTVAKTSADYACGNAGIVYLLYTDGEEELISFVKGQGNYKYDLNAEDVVDISTQEDFFRFLGLLNGSNVYGTEGFEYSYEAAAANTYKLVRMTNLRCVLISSTSYDERIKHHWRPCFSEACNTWASTTISNSANATNNIGAHQSYYPNFYNYNTYVNTGMTFSEMLFGDTSDVSPKQWTNHLVFDGTVYAMFIGGSDYYAQFVVLDKDWVIPATVE
jgi:hypothetical protein